MYVHVLGPGMECVCVCAYACALLLNIYGLGDCNWERPVCACGVHLWVKGEGRDRGQETSQAKDNTVCVGGWPVCRVMHVCVGRVCVWCGGRGGGRGVYGLCVCVVCVCACARAQFLSGV